MLRKFLAVAVAMSAFVVGCESAPAPKKEEKKPEAAKPAAPEKKEEAKK